MNVFYDWENISIIQILQYAIQKQENTYTFDDITTSREHLEKFVAFLNEENVSLKCFKIFLELFIDSL